MRHIFAAAPILLAAAFALLIVARPAAAQTIRWDPNGANPPHGIFSVANNWNPNQVPVAGNTALFDLKKIYSVTFLANAVSDEVQVLQGEVSFPGDPAILRTYNLLTGAADLIVRGGTLTVGAAGAALDLNVGDQLFIGDSVASGTVIVSGSGSRLDASGGSGHTIGFSGFTGTLTYQSSAQGTINGTVSLGGTGGVTTAQGNLNVLSGAELTTAGIVLAPLLGTATGNVTVDGSGSTLTQSGAIVLAVGSSSGGAGTVNVSNGGIFTAGTHPINVNATGLIDISTGGKFNANGPVTVDGGTINRDNTETLLGFNLASGLTLTASNNGQVNFVGGYAIDDGTTFDINSGADFSTTSSLPIGGSSDGTLLVHGAGSSVTTGSSSWGFFGGTADVTFRNGASGDLGTLQLANNIAAGTTGILNVESGATVLTDALFVASFAGATTTGTVTVDGAGSSLTLSGSSNFIFGHVSSGTATINVTNGGTFSTATGTVTLNATGTIFIDGGTFNFNGPITNNGVSINFLAGAINVAGNFTVGTAGILGGNPTLSPNKQLSVTGTTTIEAVSTLTLAGGALTTGILDTSPGGTFVWTGGNLTLTGAGPHTFASLAIPASATLATVAATTIDGPVSGQPSSAITPAGDLTIGDASSFLGFNFDGSLTVGANTVNLQSMGFANLGVLTTVAGGTLSAANGVSLGVGDNVSGNGTVNARIFADGGSTIAATGNLTLGDSSAFDGFSATGSSTPMSTRSRSTTPTRRCWGRSPRLATVAEPPEC